MKEKVGELMGGHGRQERSAHRESEQSEHLRAAFDRVPGFDATRGADQWQIQAWVRPEPSLDEFVATPCKLDVPMDFVFRMICASS